jgi:hypothetical protein
MLMFNSYKSSLRSVIIHPTRPFQVTTENMKLLLLLASTALAAWHKPLPGHFSLLARDVNGNCTAKNTCSDCYGPGNIICDNAGCFNPNKGERCCKDGCTCLPISSTYLTTTNRPSFLRRKR